MIIALFFLSVTLVSGDACTESKPVWNGEECVEFCPVNQKWDPDNYECVSTGCDPATPKWIHDPYTAATDNIDKYCKPVINKGGRSSVSGCADACEDEPEKPEIMVKYYSSSQAYSCYCLSDFACQEVKTAPAGFVRYILSPNPSVGTCEACPGATPKWDGACVASGCAADQFWKQDSLTEGHCEPCPVATPKAENNVCTACPGATPKWNGACVAAECAVDQFWTQTSLTEPFGTCTGCLAAATPIAVDNVCTACPPSKSVWDGTACVEFCPEDQKWDGVSGCVPSGCPAETPRWVDVLGYREAANQVKYCYSTGLFVDNTRVPSYSVSDCRGYCNDYSTLHWGHHGDYLYKTTATFAQCRCIKAMEICEINGHDSLNYVVSGYVRYEWGLTEGACEACPGVSKWDGTQCSDAYIKTNLQQLADMRCSGDTDANAAAEAFAELQQPCA